MSADCCGANSRSAATAIAATPTATTPTIKDPFRDRTNFSSSTVRTRAACKSFRARQRAPPARAGARGARLVRGYAIEVLVGEPASATLDAAHGGGQVVD